MPLQVHYTGRLDDGTVFDSSRGRQPLEFVVGSGKVIRGFDDCVMGLAAGKSRTERVPPENAYGAHDATLPSYCMLLRRATAVQYVWAY